MTSSSHNNSIAPSQQTAQANAASPPSKRDLKSWWRGFKLPSKHQESHEPRSQGIFGVPLRQSITYANVAISLIDEHGQSYIYGYVPIVVAKCGVFLKEKATGTQGIFRLNGSEKRIKELKTSFDSPDRYGKGLVWDGYTVHDASNVLRRYLNDLPEPVVPLDLYEKFRDPLRGATKQAVGDAEGPQYVENFDEKAAIETYQRLITELPPLNRQLLLYILDLLAVFAAKADENLMTSQNLAAIFQPGMLSHPNHALAPEEYRLNQCVIIFLIENQDHFLIGMQGTAADEKTVKEVESGTPAGPLTPNPKRSSGVRRSASNASAGADSVRRDGMLRRNRSVSSRNSKQDGSTTPNSPAVATTPTSGLGRSNTVPSKKSPALAGNKFKKPDSPGHYRGSAHLEPLTQAYPTDASVQSDRSSLTPAAAVVTPSTPSPESSVPARSQERLLEVLHETTTPQKERSLPSLFQRSPADSTDKRQPNKLKKKRIPDSLNPSAQSSSASLAHSQINAHSPAYEMANPMETVNHEENEPQRAPATLAQHNSDLSSEPTPRASQIPPSSNSLHLEVAAMGKSPPASLHSSFNEGSDIEHSGEEPHSFPSEQQEVEKKKRWRLSRAKKEDSGHEGAGVPPHRLQLGSNDHGDVSTSSIGSGGNRPRKSFTGDSSDHALANTETTGTQDSGGKEESKGPIGWFRNKYRSAKENVEHKRTKSPPADRLGTTNLLSPRGKSFDLRRDTPEKSGDAPSQAGPPQSPTGTAPPPQLQPPQPPVVSAVTPPTPTEQPEPMPAVQEKPELEPEPQPQSQPQQQLQSQQPEQPQPEISKQES
jgi:hypothetical protein